MESTLQKDGVTTYYALTTNDHDQLIKNKQAYG